MSFADLAAEESRTPITRATVALDFCANTFGVAPCTATGEPCYNTYPTCKDRSNFSRTTKDYVFTSYGAPLPAPGMRPYLKKVGYTPTEIRDNLSTRARVTITLHDEPDGDVGIDPYLAQRANVPETNYWKKLLVRNRNYRGRTVRIEEGFLEDPDGEWEQRWVGDIDAAKLGRGEVSIEVVDLLKRLDKIEVPPKLDVKLLVAVGAADLAMTLDGDDIGKLPAAGKLRLGDEVVTYSAIDPVSHVATLTERNALGTQADEHSKGEKVGLVLRYAGNGFDLLSAMLQNDPAPAVAHPSPPGAGIAAGDIDLAEFAAQRDWPGGEPDFASWIVEPTKLSTLFWEIAELLDVQVWYSEGQKITLRRRIPNKPGRSYAAWTGEANVKLGSSSADLNPDSRLSRVVLRWEKSLLGKADGADSYSRIDVSAIADAEGENDYGTPAEKVILCRWLSLADLQEEVAVGYVRATTARRVLRQRDPLAIIDLEVEIKDGAVRTGQHVRLTTDALLMPDGSPLAREIFEVIKRKPQGSSIGYRLLRAPARKIAFFAPSGTADYGAASEAQREYGFFAGADGKMSNNDEGYYWW